MMGSELGLLVLLVLAVVVYRLRSRVGSLEAEVVALRTAMSRTGAAGAAAPEAVATAMPEKADEQAAEPAEAMASETPVAAAETADADFASPWAAGKSDAQEDVPDVTSVPEPEGRDLESSLGSRWSVWVGGVALALGGAFLVRYSIEAGIFGPGMRLTMAALFGLALLGAGEFIRRTGYKVPVEGLANAYIPAILTAAGAFSLFGAIYAAHGIYGFIGPAVAFPLLGVVGVGTIGLALVHGQALAGLGLLAALATPALVASQSPNAWALFGYLAIVLAASTAIARLRDWRWVAAAGFAGMGLWTFAYAVESPDVSLLAFAFANVASIASLALLWARGDAPRPRFGIDPPAAAVALFSGLSTLLIFGDPLFVGGDGEAYGAVLAALMVAAAFWRRDALPLLFGAGVAIVLAFAVLAISGDFVIEGALGDVTVEGPPVRAGSGMTFIFGAVLAALFLAAGLLSARNVAATSSRRAAAWAGWAGLVPLSVLTASWVARGDLDTDFAHAAAGLLLAVLLVAGGEWIARAEDPPQTGRAGVSFALWGAGFAALLAVHMAFGPLWTTMALGASAALPALATRIRPWPVLGWLSVGAALAVAGRVAFDPTLVGQQFLGTTPVFNALLPGYLVPALAFVFCAWQLARTTGGRPRLAMEAAAALFGALAIAMLVRHAMNGGVIDASEPTLAEQAIYTILALGLGGILIALDMRSPSPVFRYGSMAAGIVSVMMIVSAHFAALNPLFTNESTGAIPVFNLLFLAYLLPAIAAGGLALYARGKRPRWYSAMLGLLAAALAFAFATLSVRRLFQGEFIGLWKGMGQLETWSYSALWLALGVAVLVLGVRLASQPLRIASAALIAIAVAKVFIFDMSELEGVLRALSFIGLGVVLIGVGTFYQKLLTRSAKA